MLRVETQQDHHYGVLEAVPVEDEGTSATVQAPKAELVRGSSRPRNDYFFYAFYLFCLEA